ncbi:MAG: L-2-hydroxyglutarate oxidase [Bernardetiaceae bacterium]|nr:L-2-hydroxyglutarate oxidase [Bernardetiaceae bacterium]
MQYDVLVVGGGIVGLATAHQLLALRPGLRVAVVEKETTLARHQTGHNSGVIHSGIYYKPGSLKARNCLRGYQLLLEFCAQHGVAHEVTGKIIVATSAAELPQLHNVYERGLANGLAGVRKIGPAEMKEIEPHVNGLEAIWVPQTGIVDYVGMAQKMAELLTAAGGTLHLGQAVTDIKLQPNGATVVTSQQTFTTRLVVNCAGLYSDKIAALNRPQLPYRIIPFRGEYYEIKPERQHLVKNLIYPVPDPNFPFLGVHYTRMIHGGVEAGPNAVFAFRREGYRRSDFQFREFWEAVTWPGFQKVAAKYWRTGLGEYYRSFSKAAFTRALQKLIPDIQETDLRPGGAGVRAQACERNGGLVDDFLILEDQFVINVGNAPSPAATSSLSIGLSVAEMALTKV